jgi:oligopeptide transport system permease protein
MGTYIIRRVLAIIPALLGITVITFTLMHATPAGPFDKEKTNAAIKAALMRAYHLDEPIWPTFVGPGSDTTRYLVLAVGLVLLLGGIFLAVRKILANTIFVPLITTAGFIGLLWFVAMELQSPGTSVATGFVPGQFFRFLGNLLQGDLGTSFAFPSQTVTEIIGKAAVNSFILGVTAFVLLVITAIPLGILAAVRQNTWVDYTASGLSLLGYAVPNFVTGVLLILLTGLVIRINGQALLPIAEWREFPRDLILPAIILAIRPLAVLTRVTRASMIEVLNQDYIRTAWAKGLGSRLVLMRHALRNALLPVVTVMGDHLGDLITGSIVVEFLFNVPGIGQWFVRSVQAKDYGMIMGTTLFYATLVLFINLIVDLLYGVIDPRIKLGAAARS